MALGRLQGRATFAWATGFEPVGLYVKVTFRRNTCYQEESVSTRDAVSPGPRPTVPRHRELKVRELGKHRAWQASSCQASACTMPDENISVLDAGDLTVKRQGPDTEMHLREADSVMIATAYF